MSGVLLLYCFYVEPNYSILLKTWKKDNLGGQLDIHALLRTMNILCLHSSN